VLTVLCELRSLDGGVGRTTLVLEIDANDLLVGDSFDHGKECGIFDLEDLGGESSEYSCMAWCESSSAMLPCSTSRFWKKSRFVCLCVWPSPIAGPLVNQVIRSWSSGVRVLAPPILPAAQQMDRAERDRPNLAASKAAHAPARHRAPQPPSPLHPICPRQESDPAPSQGNIYGSP
jgi:hypothetical protein